MSLPKPVLHSSEETAPATSGDFVSLRELGIILRTQKLVMATVGGSVLAAAGLYLALAQPLYRSSASMLLDPRGGASFSADATTRQAIDANVVESQVKMVSTPAVLQRVVEREHLDQNPEFVPTGEGLTRKLKSFLGFRNAPAEPIDRRQAALATLAQRLVVRRSERTLLIDLDVWSRDPASAARIANAVADAFIEDQIDAKSKATNAESAWVRGRLAELEGKIRDAEGQAEAFKIRNRILSANGRLLNEQQLETISSELAKAQMRRSEAQSRLAQLEQAQSSNDPGATAEAMRSGVIQQLRIQYAEIKRQRDNLAATLGPRHPALLEVLQQLAGLRASISAELRRLAESQKAEVASAAAVEKQLKSQVESQKRDTTDTNQAILRLRELEREAEANRAVYQRFLRANGNLAQDSVDTPVARVVAPAVAATRPASPNTKAILLIAAAAALALSLIAAVLAHLRRLARQTDGRPTRPQAARAEVQSVSDWNAPRRVRDHAF